MSRVFALVDCNNFYVSCERSFDPRLSNRPVIVLSNNDGCAVSRSQEAKDIGIKMGQPYFQCRQLLRKHGGVALSSNYALYGDMSRRVMEIIAGYTRDLEVYSIDEAFLTLPTLSEGDLIELAKDLRADILRATGVPVSIGVASSKTLCKVANYLAKRGLSPDECVLNLATLDSAARREYLRQTPVEELWGIGRRYAKFLTGHRITTAARLIECEDRWIRKHLTIFGLRLVQELRGTPCYQLELERTRKKSLAATRSFSYPVTARSELLSAGALHASRVGEKLRAQDLVATRLHVFLATNRFGADYHRGALSRTLREPTNHSPALVQQARLLIEQLYRPGEHYRKIGVVVTGLHPAWERGTDLFADVDLAQARREREILVGQVVDKLNRKYGRHKIRLLRMGFDTPWITKREYRSRRYTTVLSEVLRVR